MKQTQLLDTRRAFGSRQTAIGLAASVALGAMLGATARADNAMYRADTNAPGGVRAMSRITSQTTAGTNTTLCWYGMQGWYTVEMSTNNTTWNAVGRTASSDFPWCFTVPNGGNTNAFFRLNQLNAFVGSGGCAGCHGDKFNEWQATGHATAYSRIASLPDSVRQNCVVCHTIGQGQPTGFTDVASTPQLLNVGCETCHGPAGWHKYSDHDLVRPAVSIDPKICGGCHQDSHHPTYEEYEPTLHAEVNDDVKYGFSSGVYYTNNFLTASNTWYGYYVTTNSNGTLATNATTGIIYSLFGPANNPLYDQGQDRQAGCGICHSAAARMSMLGDYEARLAGTTNPLVFPVAKDAAAWSAACATCHDPHSDYNPAQLRNPTWSSKYYTMPTTADKRTVYTTNFNGAITTNVVFYSAAFANTYDPNIQVCGQCHNTRGARWDGRSIGYITNGTSVAWGVQTNVSFSRPPHHSPQYEVLIGIVQPDYLTTDSSGVATNWAHRHGTSVSSSGAFNTNQCATCHVPNYAVNAETNVTGHSFELDTHNCTLSGCHGSVPNYEETQVSTTNRLSVLVGLLNRWALSNAPALGLTKGSNNWDYTTTGGLAPTPNTANAGPSTSEQLKIPNAIKQARFNAYMVFHDGSLGVHNPSFAQGLLTDATNKVISLMVGATNAAYFSASASTGYAPFKASFLSWGTGITSYGWDFGDGGTSTDANPTYTYANPGTNTVKLTVTTSGGTTTYTRTNYVRTYLQPAVSFAANILSGEAPLTVTFTNTSTSTNSVTAWRWTFAGQNITTNAPVYTYTFTNPGSYSISLRATTPVGNITVTSNAFVVGTTNPAYFMGSATSGYAPLTNTFQCLGVGATSYSWSFGDGGTSTNPNPTYVYKSRGTNTVSLTVTTTGGTKTWTRPSYVTVYDLPVVSFTASPTSGRAPLSVGFVNTSSNTNSVTSWRWTINNQNITTNVPVYTYVFTNNTPTNYSISLRATTPLGSITTTSNAFITVTP